ncbi:MAG: flagellar biosynthesis anti-sigma factor FlgM [Desulfarculales bacterium]|jgi:flagellar biosynthesis anti-sigma factor FlgM|nr:flagellar biosynthesis anti-sigma factor FlgM [Desulfarculales bacterium]
MIQIKDSLGIDSKPLEQKREKPAPSSALKTTAGESASAQDKAVFSERSREAARAADIAAAAPSSRQEKIDRIKEAIANNQYQVSSEQVAERMIVDFLKGI